MWFRESWYEDLLRQLNEGLSICYAELFKHRTDGMNVYTYFIADIITCLIVANARITPEMLQYINKLVTSFGVTVDQSNTGPTSQDAARRAQAANDPAFQRLKNQFASDFDFRLAK